MPCDVQGFLGEWIPNNVKPICASRRWGEADRLADLCADVAKVCGLSRQVLEDGIGMGLPEFMEEQIVDATLAMGWEEQPNSTPLAKSEESSAASVEQVEKGTLGFLRFEKR